MQDTVAVVLNRGVAAVTRRYSSSIVVEKGDRLPGPSYEVVVSWSAADRAFVAEVPELPGCAADGASHAEAIANVEIVMREWIETAIDLGREIPVPKAG
ncbi:MAG: type II toxin-antitoxin system HicB family antitoxin [Acidobacteria bacterium]|nr:type II toxin-antitoxin system HicB family antitoxin [Acidobacteriota bacterium]